MLFAKICAIIKVIEWTSSFRREIQKKTRRTKEMKTSKFFVLFGSIVGIMLSVYLLLNLGLEILVGLTYIPFIYYILYGVGSLISIVSATFVAKKLSVKLLGIWGGITAIIAMIVSCAYNWNVLSRLFLKVLPIEAIIGFVFCFVIVLLAGFFSKEDKDT